MKNSLKYIALILISTVVGFLIWNTFFELSLTQLSKENINIVSRKMGDQFFLRSLFAISFGIIPLLYLILRKITKLKFMTQGIISLVIIFLSGILFWQFRIFQLNNRFEKLNTIKIDDGNQMEINISELNFEIFLLVGFIIGIAINILIFRNKLKRTEKL